MFSTPPARTTSASPVSMRRAAWTTDSIPDAQLRETEWAGFSFGTPARSAMIRRDVRGVDRRRDVPEDRLVDRGRLDARARHRLDGGRAAEVDGRDVREVGAGARERRAGAVDDE